MKDTYLRDLRRRSLYKGPRMFFDVLLGVTLVAILISGGAQISQGFGPGKHWIDGVNTVAQNLVGLLLVFLVRYLVYALFDLVDVLAAKERVPNQSSEPILSSVTPPAGQESRPR